MAKATEPQPNLKLREPRKPLQKITIPHMPTALKDELHRRASKYSRKLRDYCRIVLEHAIEHRSEYEGPISRSFSDKSLNAEAVHVPLYDKEFKDELIEWDPYGVRRQPEIVLSILKKHLEVRTW